MTKQDDGLFLLEVLVDKIVFVKSPCFSDRDFRTCVNIECLSVEPLEICDDDPGSCAAKSGGPFVKTFNSGKSCLFSLKEAEIASAMSKFPIKISVYKSLPCGCLPTKIVMGEAVIDMTKEFVEARRKFLEDPTTVSYQAMKDAFRITGPDGSETGEVVMFLRISCFGKLIITRFQGGGPPALGAGTGGNAIVDRSCNPKREFQTTQDPCACGAARGGGASSAGAAGGSRSGAPCTLGGGAGKGGVCPPARDPYNSMPCEDPDDPCYCTGPKQPPKEEMLCRNTDKYCLHVPKGKSLNLPFAQELTEEQKMKIKAMCLQLQQKRTDENNMAYETNENRMLPLNNEILQVTKYYVADHCEMSSYTTAENNSISSFGTLRSKKRSVSFSDTINYVSKSVESLCKVLKNDNSSKRSLFVNSSVLKQNATVYMTLFDDIFHHHSLKPQSTAGTQATASINKCFQAYPDTNSNINYAPSSLGVSSQNYSTCTMSTLPYRENKASERIKYSDVYFFGRKKDSQNEGLGMGKSKMKYQQTTTTTVTSESKTAQTGKGQASCGGSCIKSVSIKDEKRCPGETPCPGTKPCPAKAQPLNSDMVATVSHIRLGPREPCPVHGSEPCQGPKCIVASSGQEQQAPVKVTTMTNPRRGVFELVIRRITGAPLAKNELMLEWTPPTLKPPCGVPCSYPCTPSVPCRPSKCKMIVCRQPCKPKGCRKPCGFPCRPVPCRPRPCRPCPPPRCRPCPPCKPCCRPCPPPRKIFKPACPSRCGSCNPCGPCKPSSCCVSGACSSCRPFPPPPCKPCKRCKPCGPTPCRRCRACPPRKPCRPKPCSPCSPCPPISCSPPSCCSPCSVPCLAPCPIRCRRKCRSQPKIRAHRKRISPCLNRTKFCPAVRCPSVPGPCCSPCSPRKCYIIAPSKPLRCFKSCSSCCE